MGRYDALVDLLIEVAKEGKKAVDFSEMIILVWISICLLG